MANEIYNSSDWGNGVCDNTIDWGVVYKDFAGCTPSFTNTYSLAFDGVDDFVSGGDIFGFERTDVFSISAWVKRDSSKNQMIVSKRLSSGNLTGYSLRITNATNQLQVQLRAVGSNRLIVNGSTALDTNWNHVVLTYDGSSNISGVNVYLNGFNDNGSTTGTLTSSILNSAEFNIGAENSNDDFFDGNIDEVSVFNSELTSANVTSIYNSGVPNDISSISGLTAWYRNGDNGSYKSPQWLIPNNSNKDKVSNYSFDFDGVDDYVDTGISTLTGTDFSISYWFKTTATLTNYSFYVPFSAVSTQQFVGAYLYYHPTTKLTVRSKNSSGTAVSGTVDLSDGNWHNIVVTYNSTSYALKMYVDGSIDYDETIYSYANFSKPLLIGGKTSSSFLIDCSIDEASLFNSVLTSENVTSIYNSGTPNDISSLSPVGYWRSENSTFSTNWTVTDNGSGSSDGTSANMTIEDRTGDAPNSTSNALSYNMTESDRETDVPT